MSRENDPKRRLAVFTTVYPAVRKYLAPWLASALAQTDSDFDIWVAVDGLGYEEMAAAFKYAPQARFIMGQPGDTPAQVRERAFIEIAAVASAVVCADSDDVLDPTRVDAARQRLRFAELTACALRLVDDTGRDLGGTLGVVETDDVAQGLPRCNRFGLSNSSYSAGLLRRCLPIPAQARAVDWYLATRAWLLGARIDFDHEPRMLYRQHSGNMTVVRPPYSADQIARDTRLVLEHLSLVLSAAPEGALSNRLIEVESAQRDVLAFKASVVDHQDRLARYVEKLNAMPLSPSWWGHVAQPALCDFWR